MKNQYSLLNSILCRIMKEKQLYIGYKCLICPKEIDRCFQRSHNIDNRFPIYSFSYLLYDASRITREKFSDISSRKINNMIRNIFVYQRQLDGLILKILKPWWLNYIRKSLKNHVENYESYIVIKFKNKIKTLEEYIDYCISRNKNIFNILKTPIFFVKTQEGMKFWNLQNEQYTQEIFKLLCSTHNMTIN